MASKIAILFKRIDKGPDIIAHAIDCGEGIGEYRLCLFNQRGNAPVASRKMTYHQASGTSLGGNSCSIRGCGMAGNLCQIAQASVKCSFMVEQAYTFNKRDEPPEIPCIAAVCI